MKAFVLGSTAALASLAGFAVQAQDTGTGTATVTVAEAPVTIGDSSDGLEFGTVVSGGSLQTYTIPPADSSSATFVLSGEEGQTYNISLPTTATLSSGTSSSDLTVSSFLADSTGGTLPAGGTTVLQVGGTLSVPANTIAGFYSGTFTVTVNNP